MISIVWSKDLLVLGAFTVDALNTFVTFPLFVANGPKWVLKSLDPKAKEKSDDKEIVALEDTERKSFTLIWDLFLICYEGYFGFTASALICVYKTPETIPIFAYSLFALYAYKLIVMLKFLDKDDPARRAKISSVLFFFLPCYGGYCLLHLKDLLMNKQ